MTKKGSYRPASDFCFEFVAEVICANPQSSWFIIKLTPERNCFDIFKTKERYISIDTSQYTVWVNIGQSLIHCLPDYATLHQ